MSNDQSPPPKKRGCRRGCLITLLVLLVLFLMIAAVFWRFCIYAPPLRISKETTYVLGPLSADGKRIDYFRAWEEHFYPPEMQTDDNGYRLIVRAAGDLVNREYTRLDGRKMIGVKVDIDPEIFRIQVYEKLGLDPNEKPTLNNAPTSVSAMRYIQDLSRVNESVEILEMQRGVTDNPWTLETYPLMKEWIEQADPLIDIIAEAVRKPAFYIPQVRSSENKLTPSMPLNEIETFRDFALLVCARANYRIGNGDIDGAIDDTITIYRLGRHFGKQGKLVNYLVSLAIEAVACGVAVGGNAEAPPSKEQWERLLREIDALPPRWTSNQAATSERLFSLGIDQARADGINPFDEFEADHEFRWSSFFRIRDCNVVMAATNKAFDAMEAGEFDSSPVGDGARKAEQWAICRDNMKRLTLALLLYEKDRGQLPEEGEWREAVKPYLGENADKYFLCPYDWVLQEPDTPATPNTMLLVETFPHALATFRNGACRPPGRSPR